MDYEYQLLTNESFAFRGFQSNNLNWSILIVLMNNFLNVIPDWKDWTTKKKYFKATFADHAATRQSGIVRTCALNENISFFIFWGSWLRRCWLRFMRVTTLRCCRPILDDGDRFFEKSPACEKSHQQGDSVTNMSKLSS